jgi:glutamate-5-semialdehyde dehydrogenase
MMVKDIAEAARRAALALVDAKGEARNEILSLMAEEIGRNREGIKEENKRDLEAAAEAGLPKPLLARLRLDDTKIDQMIRGLRSLIQLEDPVGKTLLCTEMDEGLILYKVTCPIGVICSIFEARPDALVQIASLCIKSGNAVILKGGSEASNTNRVLVESIRRALSKVDGIPEDTVQLVETREDVKGLLQLDGYIDLIVPRGSSALVKYIKENTKIPVLGHTEGICHEYVDADADIPMAVKICYDAKVQYPAVCNAMETLLVHKDIAGAFLPPMYERFREAGVELRGCPRTREILPSIAEATEEDWSTEYGALILSIKIVDSVEEAIDHINYYGSHHTDGIITSNDGTARLFLSKVDSAVVLRNASTRFSDGYRFGFGAEIGISTNKIHARGPVGLEGLVIYKYIVLGNGHIVADYVGNHPRPFVHRRLDEAW